MVRFIIVLVSWDLGSSGAYYARFIWAARDSQISLAAFSVFDESFIVALWLMLAGIYRSRAEFARANVKIIYSRAEGATQRQEPLQRFSRADKLLKQFACAGRAGPPG